MRLLTILALLIPTLLYGQSAIPKAVNETVNITPRAKKGDLQRYEITAETRTLDDNSAPTSYRRDVLAYSQYCLGNTPEKGLDFQITIDSFAVGNSGSVTKPDLRLQIVHQLDGFRISNHFTRALPRKSGCYDLQLIIPDSLIYVEIFDFSEIFKFSNLLEQLRFTAASKLNKIGDSARVVFPDPVCMKTEKVVNSYVLKLAPQMLELTGLTTVQGRASALITVKPSISPLKIEYWAGPNLSYTWDGTLSLSGSFAVALDDGEILTARIGERADAQITGPTGQTTSNRRIKLIEFRQIN